MSSKLMIGLVCVFLTIASVACGPTKPPSTEKSESPAAQARPFEGATEFPYTASQTKQDLVLAGYRTLRPGMTLEQVKGLIGTPDMSQLNEQDPPDAAGYRLIYYLFRKDKETYSGMEDVMVMVAFSRDGLVQQVIPQNVFRLQNTRARTPAAREDVTPPANPTKGH